VTRFEPEAVIDCIDCGGRCHLLSRPRPDDDVDGGGFQAGDVVVYRCEDCNDRWDLIVPDPDDH
jgi:DNA-directed RNA polymerase subunit RPC12/RpoP